MKFNKYYAAALTAFIIWGFFSLALKPLHNYASLDILFFRVFFSTTLLLLINFVFRINLLKHSFALFQSFSKKKKRNTLLLTISGGFLLVFNWYLFMYAVNHVSLQSASLAYLICPIITTVLAFIILKEKLDKWQWLAVSICLISCAILSYGHLTEIIYSIVIAISFALYLISQRRNNEFDKFLILTIQLVIASIVLAPFYPKFGGAIPTENFFYMIMGCIVVLFTIIPLFLNLFALKGMNSSAVGILMYTNPLINFLMAIFYFKENIQISQLIAYGLIAVSILVFNKNILFKSKKKMFRFNLKYFTIFISIFIIEVIIALYIKDKFIRPYFGDYLVIFLVYYFALSFIQANKNKITVGVLVFAFAVELTQYFQVLSYFNLEKNRILRIVAGNTFSFEDLFIYTLAFLTIIFMNRNDNNTLYDRKSAS